MKEVVILKSAQELHEMFLREDFQDYRSENTALPEFDYPIVMIINHETKKFLVKIITDEKFVLNAKTEKEFLEIIQHFSKWKGDKEYDIPSLKYPVVINFDGATKTYSITEKVEEVTPDNSISTSKKGLSQKMKIIIGSVSAVVAIAIIAVCVIFIK